MTSGDPQIQILLVVRNKQTFDKALRGLREKIRVRV